MMGSTKCKMKVAQEHIIYPKLLTNAMWLVEKGLKTCITCIKINTLATGL